MKSNDCMNCHGIDKRVVGPAFNEVAAKYKGDAGAAAKLVEKVRNGGSKHLGPGADAAESQGVRCRPQDHRRLHPHSQEIRHLDEGEARRPLRPLLHPARRPACLSRHPSTPCTAPPARAWSISAAGTCRSTTARRSTSTTRCARTPGMFDVSHMRVVDVEGAGARDFLRYVLANNVDKLKTPGKALYSCLLKPDGTVHRRPDRLFPARGFLPPRRQRGHRGQGHRVVPRALARAARRRSRSRRAPISRSSPCRGRMRARKRCRRRCPAREARDRVAQAFHAASRRTRWATS